MRASQEIHSQVIFWHDYIWCCDTVGFPSTKWKEQIGFSGICSAPQTAHMLILMTPHPLVFCTGSSCPIHFLFPIWNVPEFCFSDAYVATYMTTITFCLCAFGTEKMLMLIFLKIWALCIKLRGVTFHYIKMSTLQCVCMVDIYKGEKVFNHMLWKIPKPA